MQAQITKGELLGEYRGNVVTITVKDFTPFGIRFEYNIEGEVVGERFSAHDTQTSKNYNRFDGTFEWEAKHVELTKEGDSILCNTHGTGKMTGPITYTAEGEGFFTTQSPKLLWLNGKKGRVELTGNLSTREMEGKIFVL